MDGVIQVAVIALVGALCAVVVKKGTPELGLVLALAAGGAILYCVIDRVSEIRDGLRHMAELSGLDGGLILAVGKAVGIAVVTKAASELCKDAKENGIAFFLELAGVILSLAVAVPLMERIFEEVGRLM